jgi:hypothetical protein
MESNPYNSPSANLFGSSNQTTAEAVPAEAISQLKGTKPWVRFISVLMWIGVAFMLLAGAGLAVLGITGSEMGKSLGYTPPVMITMAILYGLFSFLYIYPAVKLWSYGSAINRLLSSRRTEDLVTSLNQQRSFWKFIGMLMLIMISIYIVGIIVLIGLALFVGTEAFKGLPTTPQ